MDVVVKRGAHDSPASKRVNYGAFLRVKDAYRRICFSKSKQKFDTVKGGKNIPNEVLDFFFIGILRRIKPKFTCLLSHLSHHLSIIERLLSKQ